MKLLERRLTLYDEKYGLLSEDFYKALMSGQLAQYDEYGETCADFTRWKGIYETWLRRKEAYEGFLGGRLRRPQNPSLFRGSGVAAGEGVRPICIPLRLGWVSPLPPPWALIGNRPPLGAPAPGINLR